MAPVHNDAATNVLCNKCRNKVVKIVKCQKCSQPYHSSCAKKNLGIFWLKREHFHLLWNPNIDQIDNDFWNEIEDMGKGSSPQIDVRLFAYIIKQEDKKHCAIKHQHQQILLLENQLNNV